MKNKDIARMLRQTALLMELSGANAFKSRAYDKAADAVRGYTGKLAEELLAGQAPVLEGLGKSSWAAVQEFVETGSYSKLEELKKKVPEGVVELSRLPGLGPKKLISLWKEHQITSPAELMEAAEQNRISQWKGFGEKTQANLYNALLYYTTNKSRKHLNSIWELARDLQPLLEELEPVQAVWISGTARRNLTTHDELELVAASPNPNQARQAVKQALENDWAQYQMATEKSDELRLLSGDGFPVVVYFRTPEDAGLFLLSNTGSPEHLKQLKDLADYEALPKPDKPELDPVAQETALYQACGLPWIPPELREGRREVERAQQGRLPELLLQAEDIQGILHAHSTWSDGVNELKVLAEACRGAGYHYLGLTDHSRTAAYAGGLTVEQVQEQWKEIEILNRQLAPFRIFRGIESDILPNGSLDYPQEVLAEFEFIIASVHSGLNMNQEKATERLLKAIQNPYTTLLGHPTGRLLLNREGYPLDFERLLQACAEHQVAVEINANPYRLDLDWTWVERALELGVKLAICPDAHSLEGLGDVHWGCAVGRKGYLTPADTLNAWSVQELDAYFQQRRSQATSRLPS